MLHEGQLNESMVPGTLHSNRKCCIVLERPGNIYTSDSTVSTDLPSRSIMRIVTFNTFSWLSYVPRVKLKLSLVGGMPLDPS